jgi:hypothetical protein
MFARYYKLALAVICVFAFDGWAYDYDLNDFVVEVVDYIEGTGLSPDYIYGNDFNDPNRAFGRPTIDTTGDNIYMPPYEIVPVVGVYAPFRSFELVTVGHNGRLILKFNHPVADDENNPYGIDFIIFGNASQNVGLERPWLNGDPNQFVIGSSDVISDPAFVRVSQTGDINDPNQWYEFTNGPLADDWAPTFGRVYDPCNPDPCIGEWWGKPTDPTIPLDPNLTSCDFVGETVAYMSQMYGQSAGGAGFDLKGLDPNDYEQLTPDPNSGRKWIKYVWIKGNEYYTPEVDAVSDVACCGDYKHPFPVGDLTRDCKVDYMDVEFMTGYWLVGISEPNEPANIADIYEDDIINFRDWAVLAAGWSDCTWSCD